MSLSAASRSFTTTPPTSASPSNITPHRRLSRKRIPSPPRTVVEFSAFESSRVPQVSLHTYPSTNSLADLYASHGRITPNRRSPVGSRCSSRGGAKIGFDGGDELQMFATVIPASQANIHLPPTPPSGSGGEGDDDEGGVPLTIDFDGVFGTSPRNRRVLRRVKANIHDVSPPSQSGSASMSVASDSTTTLSSPPTPPKEQVVMALHHPRPLSKSPKSAYFEDSFLTSGLHMQQGDEVAVDTYYGAGVKDGYRMEDKLEPRFENDERDEEPFEVRRAESIKVTKAESIKVRKVEELEARKAEELEVGKVEEPEATTVEALAELKKELEQLDPSREYAPIHVSTGFDKAEANMVARDLPEQPKLIREPAEASLPVSSPTLEAVIFSESEFETATEGDEEEYGASDTETIVIKLQTTVQEQRQREEEEANKREAKKREAKNRESNKVEANKVEANKEEDDDEDDEDEDELVQHPVTGKERRKPTPWPTPRVNSYASSTNRKAETGSPLSEDGDLIFHDALSSPLASPVTTPREEELSLPNLSTPITPKKKSDFVISFGPTPTRSSPGDPSSSAPVLPGTPQKPPPPVLNIIPATPMPLMSPSAMLEKQLGDHSIPLLERKPTGIPTLLTTAPTLPLAAPIVPARLKKPQRPSLQSQPKRLRESKLHPWWRPRPEGGEDEGLSKTFTINSQVTDYSVVHNSVVGNVDVKRGGRVTKRIKGTKFEIEFIGLGTLRDKVRVAGEKTSGLGRKMSLRKRAQ